MRGKAGMAFFALAWLGCAAAVDAGEARLALPVLEPAPVIDGALGENEWRAANRVAGFLATGAGTAAPYATEVHVGHHGTRLFVALRGAYAEGMEFAARERARDEDVFRDDAFEIFLADPAGHWYNFIVNAAGSVMDGRDDDYAGWDFDFEHAVSADDGGWTLEVCIDLARLGPAVAADGWRGNFARDLNREIPDNVRAGVPLFSQLIDAPAYLAPERFPALLPTAATAGPRVTRSAEIKPGEAWLSVEFPHWNALWDWQCRVFQGDTVLANVSTVLDGIRSGERAPLPECPPFEGAATVEYILTDTSTATIMQRGTFRAERYEPFRVTLGRYFLSRQAVEVTVDLGALAGAGTIGIALELLSEGGTAAWEERLAPTPGTSSYTAWIPAAELPPGEYRLAARVERGADEAVAREIRLRVPSRPDWADRPVAATENVVPMPWTPVTVDGRAVSVWGREYVFAENGLLEQVASQGRTLLNRPQRLYLTVDRQRQEIRGGGLRVTERRDDAVTVAVDFTAGAITGTLATTVEFDGFTRTTLTLRPGAGGAAVQRMALITELDAEASEFFHHGVTEDYDFLRFDTWGNTLRTPEQWSSPFRPLLSFHSHDTGLQWYCESAEGWRNADADKRLFVRRQGRTTAFEARFIDRATPLREEIAYTWGVMATPVKPFPQHWRNFRFCYRPHNIWGHEKNPNLIAYGAAHGVTATYLHEPWTNNIFNAPDTPLTEQLGSFARACEEAGVRLLLYNSNGISEWSPELALFGEDFKADTVFNETGLVAPQQRVFASLLGLELYERFWIPAFLETVGSYGIGGVYMDGTPNPVKAYNPALGFGYRDEKGRWRPRWNIFGTREYMKQFHITAKKQRPDFLFLGHVSGGMFMPSCSFLDYAFNGENYSMHPGKVMTEGEFFGEFNGWSLGVPSTLYHHAADINRYFLDHDMTMAFQSVNDQVFWTYDFTKPWLDADRAPTRIWKMYDDYRFEHRTFMPWWRDGGPVPSPAPGVRVSAWLDPASNTQVVALANLEPGGLDKPLTLRLPAAWGRLRAVSDPLAPNTAVTFDTARNTVSLPWDQRWNWRYLALQFEAPPGEAARPAE